MVAKARKQPRNHRLRLVVVEVLAVAADSVGDADAVLVAPALKRLK
jgi:hypothetical protein